MFPPSLPEVHMSRFLEPLEPRRLLSASTATLNADMAQFQRDQAAGKRDALLCVRSLLSDATSLTRDLSHLPNTASNRTLINQLKTDLRGVGGGVLFGLGSLITTVS